VRVYFRHPLAAALLLSATTLTGAEEQSSWLENTIATCEREYDAAQCSDPEFLEQHYHVRTLQIAHKAAIRHRQEEQNALRELSLQRLCDQDPKKFCGTASADCILQMQQMCADIKRRAELCTVQAQQFCLDNPKDNCLAERTRYCPSAKKQDIATLLAKYPKLTPTQKNRIAGVAQQMDAKNSNLIERLFEWLGF
jgi:hypothetical protein